MTRIALVDSDGIVYNVILADVDWAKVHAEARGMTAVEVSQEQASECEEGSLYVNGEFIRNV